MKLPPLWDWFAMIGLCVVVLGACGALGVTDFRLYVGDNFNSFCEANKK